MNKVYGYAIIFILFGAFVCGVYFYGRQAGYSKCILQQYEKQQDFIISQESEKEKAQNTVDSASLVDIRRLLCQNARGGCKERTDN